MENKIDKIKKFLKEHIAELDSYLDDENNNYDECERHDCRVAIQECTFILDYINSL